MEAITLISDLRDEGLVEMSYGMKSMVTSSPISTLTDRGIADAQAAVAGEFYADKNGKYVLYTFKQLLHLRFSRASDDSAGAKRLRELLQLDPNRYSFAIIDSDKADIEKTRLLKNQVPAALDPKAVWTEVALQNRSMIEIMSLLAQTIKVPESHVTSGVVKGGTIANDLFTVKCSASRPRGAAVKVHRRGYWFYIDATDHRSKDTFALLNALFAVTGGTVPGAHPVLTLPVGG